MVCAAGAHAVARYAKLPVLFQPRACILHTPYALQMAGYLKFIFQVAFCVSVGFGKMADV